MALPAAAHPPANQSEALSEILSDYALRNAFVLGGAERDALDADAVARIRALTDVEVACLRAQLESVTKERDEADRLAGAAQRRLAYAEDSISCRQAWLARAKAQWGAATEVSFDEVWAQALVLKGATEPRGGAAWSVDNAVTAAHLAGFAGRSWVVGPEELAHLLNTIRAPAPAVADGAPR